RLFGEGAAVWIGQGLIALAIIGPFLLAGMAAAMMDYLRMQHPFTTPVLIGVDMLRALITVGLTAGMTHTALKQLRGEPVRVADLFAAGRFYLPLLLLTIISIIMLVFGCALCCIPGILVSGLLVPTVPLLMDRRTGVWKTLGLCIRIARQNLLLFSIYSLVWLVIYGVGAGTVVGIVFALPLVILSSAVAYYDLTYGISDTPGIPGAPAMPPAPPYQPPPMAP
ncbi:MAG TPA: hypothetical protein PLZ36_12305, partial [Armatimonadota bacterium]|nr:hypothetical protein [Armatimonadota bacterium]